MKSLMFFAFVLSLYFNLNAQIVDCNVDPDCNESIAGNGTICPQVLPSGFIDIDYFQTITIIPPRNYEGLDAIHSIRIDSVGGLPQGIDWAKNQEIFYTTTPPTRYCITLDGAPQSLGDHQLKLFITPFINIFGVPVEYDQMTDDTTFTLTVFENTGNIVDFYASKTLADVNDEIQFVCNSMGNIVSRNWSFEGGNPNQADDENPVVVWTQAGIYTVSLEVEFDTETDIVTKENYIIIEDELSIFELKELKINIFPNPATDMLNIEGENLNKLLIFDVNARLITEKLITNGFVKLDITKFRVGTYFLILETDNGVFRTKISKI
jgi:PKD repeat protein